MTEKRRNDIRNIAIIAHVDHGKTTLVDSLLKKTGEFKVKADEAQECVLDSNDLERERGITILAKNTSVQYGTTTINIVDTPGHADFSSEVERILRMVEGALLIVDAVDGPMPQTRFVLQKSLQAGLKPIVIINKMDRAGIDPHRALDRVFDLFVSLKATDDQLDFSYLFASGREGWVATDEEAKNKFPDLKPLFDLIVEKVPGPIADETKPLQILVTMLEWNNFVGQVSLGRIVNGKISSNQPITLIQEKNKMTKGRVTLLEKYFGLGRRSVPEALAGDIVAIGGVAGVRVGDTIAGETNPQALERIQIEPPTMSIEISVNDSPFVGQDGEFLTSRHIRERLLKEQETNAGLLVEERGNTGIFKVSGRGELHLTVLLETMRREGFEMSVSKPEVILHEENGKVVEPAEGLLVDVEEAHQGAVMENLGKRGAQMKNMMAESGRIHLEYVIASRCLLGFKSEFLMMTKGTGVMHQSFHGFVPKTADIPLRTNGVLVSMEAGETTAYALDGLQDRSVLFVSARVPVYVGMVIGENSRDQDMVVNACKGKKLTNMRASGTDDMAMLAPPRNFSLEQAIEYIERDELVEITPKNIRIRKRHLTENARKKSGRS